MNTTLILALLNLGLQYSPQLIADFLALIRGNPMQPGETDQAYIARLNTQTAGLDAEVQAQNAAIQSGGPIVQSPAKI